MTYENSGFHIPNSVLLNFLDTWVDPLCFFCVWDAKLILVYHPWGFRRDLDVSPMRCLGMQSDTLFLASCLEFLWLSGSPEVLATAPARFNSGFSDVSLCEASPLKRMNLWFWGILWQREGDTCCSGCSAWHCLGGCRQVQHLRLVRSSSAARICFAFRGRVSAKAGWHKIIF